MAHGDLLKIGFTCASVEDRAAELSSTGVPRPFEIEFFQLTEDVEEVKKLKRGSIPNSRQTDRTRAENSSVSHWLKRLRQ
jgi:hypothetical protein